MEYNSFADFEDPSQDWALQCTYINNIV